jgi:Rrf2 family transcriptional regulator, iron-sulfur cluster assembly transcription factor
MLSNTCKYALRALIYLAKFSEKGKKIGIKKITKDLGISGPFLGKILQFLVRQKLLVSIKGPHGGFALARDSKDISLHDIIVQVDGEEYFANCLIGLEPCISHDPSKPLCPVHKRYSEIRDEIASFYQNTSLFAISEDIERFEDLIKL